MSVVAVRRLFEAHLPVADLDRSIAFYRDVVGLTFAHAVPERLAAFLWIGQPGQSMLGLWSIGSAPQRVQLHIAFEVTLESIIGSVNRLRDVGVTPRHGADRTPVLEPMVIGWMPAATVYFDDPDGHSLEFICMLHERPAPDRNWVPLSQWRKQPQLG
jgi:catechol 2,3-dioxygenase-like lactoylglutathione lyase family enzyme